MSALLSAHQLSLSYGARSLFDQITFSIGAGETVGLVGPNGVGKTTLLRVLSGDLTPDNGRITTTSGATVGYLPQDPTAPSEVTVQRYLEEVSCDLGTLSDSIATLAEELEKLPPDTQALPALLKQYSALQESFERRGGYTLEHRFQAVLSGLNLEHIPLDTLFTNLSGGQRARVALAAVLLQQPEILLLDEPTNHLDASGLKWLEEYLSGYPHGVVVVSHDRCFLDRTTTAICELPGNGGALVRYGGNYSNYLIEKENARRRQQETYETYKEETHRLQRLIRSRTFSKKAPGKLRDGNKMAYDRRGERHQQSESQAIAQAREKLKFLKENPAPRPSRAEEAWLRLMPYSLQSECALELQNVTYAYEDSIVLDNICHRIYRGTRICLVGPNGVGKTTLLKILAEILAPSEGAVLNAPTASIAYLSQHSETLDETTTVLKEYEKSRSADAATLRKELATCGLFGDDRVHTHVGDLSFGQKQKLQLAKIIASKANILLLDEPTNHLDLNTLEALETALLDFEGVIIAATHDRWFIDHIATDLWQLSEISS